jgi:hypothetical protein
MNLYGFGHGDRINFSDPFGLCDKKNGEGTLPNGECYRIGGALGMAIGGAFSEAMAAIKLFRAVKDDELADLASSGGRFRNRPELGSGEGKYFSTTQAGASQYARMAGASIDRGANFTIVETSIPRAALAGADATAVVDRGIPTVVVPQAALPKLSPANVVGPPSSK